MNRRTSLRDRYAVVLTAAICACLLSGCSTSDPAPPSGNSGGAARFSAEDKRAARALSLGSGPDLGQVAQDPRQQALLCIAALGTIETRFGNTGAMSAEQTRALEQAKAVYRTKAGLAGRSPADVADALKKATRQSPDVMTSARRAIGCLRNLAS